jgi:hypothetical protein
VVSTELLGGGNSRIGIELGLGEHDAFVMASGEVGEREQLRKHHEFGAQGDGLHGMSKTGRHSLLSGRP